jgi:hypothetical protein
VQVGDFVTVDHVLPGNSRRVTKGNVIPKDKYALTDHKKTSSEIEITSANSTSCDFGLLPA